MSAEVTEHRLLLDAVPTPVVLVGPGGRAAYANPAAQALAGGALPLEPLARAAAGERLDNVELDWQAPDGQRCLRVSAEVLARGAEVLALVNIEDITALRAAERRSAFLAQAGEILGASLDVEVNLARLAELAVPDRADWCSVHLRDLAGEIHRVAAAGTAPPGAPAPDDVLAGGAPLLTDEAIIFPLRNRRHVAGALTLAGVGRGYDVADLALVGEVAARASTALENAGLHEQMRYIARTLQASLLPDRLPDIPGCELAARYRAAGEEIEVGGDFYDVFALQAGTWAIVLGDVVGKGPPAAALTAMARFTTRAGTLEHPEPSRALGLLNEALLREDSPDRLMTVVHGVLALGPAPALTLASAGHPPALLLRGDRVTPLREHGPLLGVAPQPVLPEQRVELVPGDVVVLYTDGLTDAGAPERLLTLPDLCRTLEGAAGSSAEDVAAALEALAAEAGQGSPRDDLAIVVLRYTG